VLAYDLLSGHIQKNKAKVTHRDIKGANVLIDDNGVARLADWGTASLEDFAPFPAEVENLIWRAPEVARLKQDLKAQVKRQYKHAVDAINFSAKFAKNISKKVIQSRKEACADKRNRLLLRNSESVSGMAADGWSTGVTLYTHYTGKDPFRERNHNGKSVEILAQLDAFRNLNEAGRRARLFNPDVNDPTLTEDEKNAILDLTQDEVNAIRNVPKYAQDAILALLVDAPEDRKSPREARDLLWAGMKEEGLPNQTDRAGIIAAATQAAI
jgi:serine/threonine protein kinase